MGRTTFKTVVLAAGLWLAGALPGAASQGEEDLAAARALFERNVAAIQAKDREAYLACYLPTPRLVRVGPDGMQLGFDGFEAAAPTTASDDWPDSLVARDLRLAWVRPGVVYGTYRYHVVSRGAERDGISTRLFVRADEGWRIAVTSAFDGPAGLPPPPVALVGATLYDGAGGAPVRDAAILVAGGRIERVGPRAEVELPDGVDVVDLTGRFVTPGLVDAHVHFSQTGWADGRPDALDVTADHPYAEAMATCRLHPERFQRAFLASGVTAVFDVGGYPWTRGLERAAEASPYAPHVSATGPLLATWVPKALNLPDQQQMLLLEDEEDAAVLVRAHAAQGSKAIKVWFIVHAGTDMEHMAVVMEEVVEEARLFELPVVVHATTLESARVAALAGCHFLVHSVEDKPVDDAFVEALLSRGTYYCPTLTVSAGYEQLYKRELSEELLGQLVFVHPSVRRRVLATGGVPPAPGTPPRMVDTIVAELARQRGMRAQNLARLAAAGVPIVLGTDAGNPLTLHGPAVFPEMEAMQAAGLAPLAVLTAATRDGARAMGRGADLGLVAEGRSADLVVLEKDPALDIANMRAITHVMRAGLLHQRRFLLQEE